MNGDPPIENPVEATMNELLDEIADIQHRLEEATKALERIQNEGDIVSNAIATQALFNMERIQ